MFIQLPLSWIQHPFPTSSFRITSADQIRVLRGLGLSSVHYVPARSILSAAPAQPQGGAEATPADGAPQPGPALQEGVAAASIEEQALPISDSLARYRHAADAYESIAAHANEQPLLSCERAQSLVQGCLAELAHDDACAVRLLADSYVPSAAAHAVNVMVLALLLGRALQLNQTILQDVGLAALLHDIGKVTLPAHIGEPGARLHSAELLRYQAHVGVSVAMGQKMGLSSDVLIAIAQHHERADGSGFPLRLTGEDFGRNSQILALANGYERLCNPLQGAAVHTPHEAVSMLYAQQRHGFDPVVLSAFIRMMGVYPPGSLVQLVDGRHGLVTWVDSAHPLRPSVVVHEPGQGVRPVDLWRHKQLGIRRSLRPSQLPPSVLAELWPQGRLCYFFERTTPPPDESEQP